MKNIKGFELFIESKGKDDGLKDDNIYDWYVGTIKNTKQRIYSTLHDGVYKGFDDREEAEKYKKDRLEEEGKFRSVWLLNKKEYLKIKKAQDKGQ